MTRSFRRIPQAAYAEKHWYRSHVKIIVNSFRESRYARFMEEFFEIADPVRLEPATLATNGFDSGFDWTKLLDTDIVLANLSMRPTSRPHRFSTCSGKFRQFCWSAGSRQATSPPASGQKAVAMVMLASFETPDFDGFVQLRPKQNDNQYFYLNLGGFAHGRSIIFDTDTSRIHVQRCLTSGGKILWPLKPFINN